MATANALLLVVDAQVGFVKTKATRKRIDRIRELLNGEQDSLPVAFTKFRNFPGSPFVRFLPWRKLMTEDKCMIASALRSKANLVFEKSGYTALTSKFRRYLQTQHVKVVYLCGFDTDCCVSITAAGLFELGIRPVVLSHYCASTSSEEPKNLTWQGYAF